MIKYLQTTENKVILVVIDYAGLTTDPDDLLEFIRQSLRESLHQLLFEANRLLL